MNGFSACKGALVTVCLGFTACAPTLEGQSASARPTSQATASATPEIRVFELNKPFELPISKIAQLKQTHFYLSWNSPPQDSRCPKDARCVWAGEVKVTLSVRKEAHTEMLSLSLPSKNTVTLSQKLGNFQLTLNDVFPYPGKPETNETLRLSLTVSKSSNQSSQGPAD